MTDTRATPEPVSPGQLQALADWIEEGVGTKECGADGLGYSMNFTRGVWRDIVTVLRATRSESERIRWIPVKERRPGMGHRVMLWDAHRGIGIGWWVMRDDTENAWQYNGMMAFDHFNITHWREEIEGPDGE